MMIALTLQKLKRSVLTASARLIEAALAVAAVLGLGLMSSWYMVEAGTRLTTERVGPWVTWTSAAKPDADPYTRAHFAGSGTLAVSTDVQRTFVAKSDSDGERLTSSCEYQVAGKLPQADWWSIVVFDAGGMLISNPAGRHAFTSQTVAVASNGAFTVTLAREARPGNWLPTRGAGRISIVLTVIEPRSGDGFARASDGGDLPTIGKIRCR
ncbi:MAG: DUF1214 domain-containing protein [Hyphomicrobium aestuarii]|nr:DUF1214 domain-containing protein [Hyphomicrobium aestuarii]